MGVRARDVWGGKRFKLFGMRRLIVLLAAAIAAFDLSAQVLRVESVSGPVWVQEDSGVRCAAAPGQVLAQGQRVVTEDGANARLQLSRHGFLELGEGSILLLERLPHASFATDLRSVFRLEEGYLRVVWKHPQISTIWPLFVYVDDLRTSLTTGEFFIEHRGGRLVACVAAGEIAVEGPSQAPGVLHPRACYRLYRGLPAQRVLRDEDDWVAIRKRFRIGELAPEAAIVTAPAAVDQTAVSRASVPAAPPALADASPQPEPTRAVEPAREPEKQQSAEASAAPKGGPWALAIASFRDAEPAQALRERALRAGIAPVALMPVTIRGQPWLRVVVTGFASAGQARAAKADIERRLGVRDAWVLRYEP